MKPAHIFSLSVIVAVVSGCTRLKHPDEPVDPVKTEALRRLEESQLQQEAADVFIWFERPEDVQFRIGTSQQEGTEASMLSAIATANGPKTFALIVMGKPMRSGSSDSHLDEKIRQLDLALAKLGVQRRVYQVASATGNWPHSENPSSSLLK